MDVRCRSTCRDCMQISARVFSPTIPFPPVCTCSSILIRDNNFLYWRWLPFTKNVRRHVNVKLSVCQGYPSRQICMSRHMMSRQISMSRHVLDRVLRAISWRICRKHMKFTISWPSLVFYECLHAYAAMRYLTPCSCACAAAVRSSIALFTTAADLNAVCVFLHNKKTLHAIFCVFMAQKRITKNMARRFSRSGDFSIVSRVFRCQGCLTRHCLVAVCQGVKVLSPDIFALQSSFVSKGQISNINTRVSYIKQ